MDGVFMEIGRTDCWLEKDRESRKASILNWRDVSMIWMLMGRNEYKRRGWSKRHRRVMWLALFIYDNVSSLPTCFWPKCSWPNSVLPILPVCCWKLSIIVSYFVIREGSGPVKTGLARNQHSDFCGYLASNGLRGKWLERTPASPPLHKMHLHLFPLFLSSGLILVSCGNGTQLTPRNSHFLVGCSLWQQPLHNELLLKRPGTPAFTHSLIHPTTVFSWK